MNEFDSKLSLQLASLVSKSLKTKNQSPYASNWLERLRKIKHLRAKVTNGIRVFYGGSFIHFI